MLEKFQIFILISFLFSCTADQRKTLKPLSQAIAKSNEIIVVCDNDDWEGALGDTIRYYFESPYLILPQPEPVFDLRHFSAEDLNNQPLRKLLRTYLLIGDLQDEHSITTNLMKQDISPERVLKAKEDIDFNTMIGKNKWANGQMLVYLFGHGEENLARNIRLKFPAIAERVREFDANQLNETVYVFGPNLDLSLKAKEELDIDIKIPSEYKLAIEDLRKVEKKDTTSFIWMRKETEDASSNIMLYSLPYSSKEQFSKENIKGLRDKLGMEYVSTSIEGSYMQINDEDLPMYSGEADLNGLYAWETRGIWEMKNDFLGGAFVSYLIHHKEKGTLVLADAFVYAPGKDKRNYMLELEHILKSIKI